MNASTAFVEESLANVGAVHHGPEHVRRRARGPWRDDPLERLVGRQPALPRAGVRAHAPPARSAADARAAPPSRSSPTASSPRSSRPAGGRRRGRRDRRRSRDVIRQYLAAGHVDEAHVSLVPVLLGGGERLLRRPGERDRVRAGPCDRGTRRDAPPLPRRAVTGRAREPPAKNSSRADVAELVDAHGSGPCGRNPVEVQVLSSA